MKQKLTALLLVLLLAVTLVLPVMAAAPYVDDEAAILTLSEVETLEARAAEISEHYGVGVYICIVDDFGDYGYPDAATASYSIYHAQSLGYGSGRDGILLLLSMSNRKYATFVYGDKAEPSSRTASSSSSRTPFSTTSRTTTGTTVSRTILRAAPVSSASTPANSRGRSFSATSASRSASGSCSR